jgi:pimeloyl-ACP methyl ester carboxylesterase
MLQAIRADAGRGLELEVLSGGEGEPLVWLHGVRHPGPDDPLLEALAARFRLFAPILPGRADLDELQPFPTIHDLVLAYDSALEALGVGPAILGGHCFGGLIAAELAAHCPGRARALVLASPLGLWNDAHPVEDLFARPHGQVDELLWRGSTARPEAPPADPDPVEAGIALAHALGGVAKYTWPIPDRGLRGRLYRITAPALLLFPKDDALVPAAYAHDFAEGLNHSRAHPLAGGHMAPYEAPEAFAGAIAEFASSVA